jgi:prepilin-type N-terminal cleavage/methylation domain-containing protein
MARFRRAESGFTLLEVMLSFVILAVGMLGVGSMLVSSMSTDKYTEDMRDAWSQGITDVEALKSGESTPPAGLDAAISGGKDYFSQRTVNAHLWPETGTPSGLSQVDVLVRFGGRDCSQTAPGECKYSLTFSNFVPSEVVSTSGP